MGGYMAKSALKLPTNRVISIWQPWAWAIIHLGKDIKNRTWKTNVRGDILIHTSRTTQNFEQDREEIQQAFGIALPTRAEMAFGALIGIAELYDCTWSEDGNDGWGLPQSWHWHLRNARPLPQPIPYRGSQGFFNVKL